MQTEQIFSHPARFRAVPTGQRQADLLSLVRQRHAFDAAVFDEHPPFFWDAEISNDQLDSHFTHMSGATLANYAAEAQAGVSFLRGHNWRELPIGRSLSGLLEQGERTRVLAGFYTVAGLPDTDDLIRRMRSGLLTDVSVGFFGGQMTCDICHRDYWDWDCPHVPGLKYETKEGDVVRQVLATFTIDGAHLAEVSGVFDGSTPDAVILKAQQESEAGRLRPEAARVLEARYRIKLPAAHRAWAGYSPEGQERKQDMDLVPKEVEAMRAVLDRHGIGQGKGLEEAVGLLDIELERLRDIQAQSGELAAQAADGRQYRSDLVAEALAEGVRAYGQEFDKPTYEGMLRDAPLAVVKRMKQDWQTIGDSRFAPGRQTTEGEQEGERTPRKMRAVPDSAYIG